MCKSTDEKAEDIGDLCLERFVRHLGIIRLKKKKKKWNLKYRFALGCKPEFLHPLPLSKFDLMDAAKNWNKNSTISLGEQLENTGDIRKVFFFLFGFKVDDYVNNFFSVTRVGQFCEQVIIN